MSRQDTRRVIAGILVFSGLFVTACERVPQEAMPVAPTTVSESNHAVVSNDTFQLNFVLNNPCTGENIRWQGPLHVVMRLQSDRAGGYTVGWTQNAQQIVGTGLTSGDTYRLVGVYTYQEHMKPPFPQTINREFRRRWISQGSAPDAVVFGYYRVTVDANGVTRLDAWDPWSILAPECH